MIYECTVNNWINILKMEDPEIIWDPPFCYVNSIKINILNGFSGRFRGK